MPSARYVYFSGGEPLYVKNNQKFIADLVQKDYAKNIDISLTSNGTLYLEKTMNLLKQFKSVGINFSIDGIGEKFNYIRHPGNFDDWVKNVLRIKKENPQWFIQTIISISMFNVWDFAETYEFCKINDLNPTINFVHDNRSAKFMPKKLKEKFIKKLMEYKSLDPQWISYRESIINFLNNSKHNYLTWKMFWYECKQRDKFRKENFQEVFPEYYNEIKNYI
jgi:MoaA/NifB/PqqE/SkfB family radical SAM enzyme